MTMGRVVELKYHSLLASEQYRNGQHPAPVSLPSRRESISVFSGIKTRRPALGQALY